VSEGALVHFALAHLALFGPKPRGRCGPTRSTRCPSQSTWTQPPQAPFTDLIDEGVAGGDDQDAAAKEPAFEFKLADKAFELTWQNVESVKVN
jgi:hypothetical protein